MELSDGETSLLKTECLEIFALPTLSLLDAGTCGIAVLPVIVQNISGHTVYFSTDAGNSLYDSVFGPPYYTEYIIDTGEEITFYGMCIDTVTGCSSGWEETAVLSSSLYPAVTILGDSIITKGNPVVLYLEDDYETYLWSDGSMIPQYTADTAGMVYVNVTDGNGCRGDDSIEITDALSGRDKNSTSLLGTEIYAFSPNGDGYNDSWVLDGIESFPGAKIFVMDKNGRTVYQNSGNYLNEWDGTFLNRRLPVDSYYFIIDLSLYNLPMIYGIVSIIY